VDIGDKQSSFIGSKQWIGSTEVGFVLEKALGVESRFISVNSGEEMSTRASDLADHFASFGGPVMIGGGVLAHTIIGVAVDKAAGEAKWLILDPHFTGVDWSKDKEGKLSENSGQITQKGWVGWKGTDFWKKGAFYNMCLPQTPKDQW